MSAGAIVSAVALLMSGAVAYDELSWRTMETQTGTARLVLESGRRKCWLHAEFIQAIGTPVASVRTSCQALRAIEDSGAFSVEAPPFNVKVGPAPRWPQDALSILLDGSRNGNARLLRA